jgi:hypothetical protein
LKVGTKGEGPGGQWPEWAWASGLLLDKKMAEITQVVEFQDVPGYLHLLF